jgi:F0F1-type ATP synthase membrane subunit b/b'
MVEHGAEHATGPGVMELIKLANLLVVVAIVYFGAKKGIVAMLKSRKDDVSRKLIDSKKELERVQAELVEAKREIAKIEDLKRDILNQVRQEGEKASGLILADAKHIAEKIVSDAKVAAQDETRVAFQKLRERIVSEAVDRSAQDLGVSSKTEGQNPVHQKLMSKFVVEASSAKINASSKVDN